MSEMWKYESAEDEPRSWPTEQQASNPVPAGQWDGRVGSLIGASIRHGIQAFRQNTNPFLVIGLAFAGLSVVLTFVRNAVLTYEFGVNAAGEFVINGPSVVETFLVNALGVAIGALVYVWFANASHRIALGGQRLLASDAFKVPQAAAVFWAAVIMVGATTLGSGLLVIPGAIAWFFLCFAPLAALDGSPGVGASIKASASLVRANVGPVFLLQLVIAAAIIPIALIGLAFVAAGARVGAFGAIVTFVLTMVAVVGFVATAVGANVYAFRVLQGKSVAA